MENITNPFALLESNPLSPALGRAKSGKSKKKSSKSRQRAISMCLMAGRGAFRKGRSRRGAYGRGGGLLSPHKITSKPSPSTNPHLLPYH